MCFFLLGLWFVYYLGYVSTITTPTGEVIPLQVEKSDNGLLKLIIPEGVYGIVNVWYDGTQLQEFSYIISVVTILCVCMFTGIYKFKKYKKASKK